jgi:hypothetical protein
MVVIPPEGRVKQLATRAYLRVAAFAQNNFPRLAVRFQSPANNYAVAMFFFPHQLLQELKIQATQYAVALGVEWLSTNDLLCAIIWAATASSRGSTEEAGKVSALSLPVDMRKRMDPPLPHNYIGNALAMCYPTAARHHVLAAARDATAAAIAHVAVSVRQALREINSAEMKSLLDFVQQEPDLNRVIWAPCHPEILVSSWKDQKTYTLDWGSVIGSCEGLSGPKPQPADMAIVLPEKQHEGTSARGLTVVVSLRKEHMQRFVEERLVRSFAQLKCIV